MAEVQEKLIVGIADLIVVHNPAVLTTIGLGSCVAISFRDPVTRYGGLAHILLPSIKEAKNKDNPLKFADSAIEKAVEMMLAKGCAKSRIESKIAGGASMFSFGESMNVGARNIEAVKRKLGEMGIPILANDTGGNYGRTVIFDIASGVMVVKSAFHGIKEI